jgi:hypothetical protein
MSSLTITKELVDDEIKSPIKKERSKTPQPFGDLVEQNRKSVGNITSKTPRNRPEPLNIFKEPSYK